MNNLSSIEPMIGVVIPTYNRTDYLSQAVTSILNQTYKNLEIIIIDDAPSDNLALQQLFASDSRLTVVRNTMNLGLASSINKGIKLLSNQVSWCTVLCDDDELDAGYLELLVRAISERNIKHVLYGQIRYMDERGMDIRTAQLPPTVESSFSYLKNRSDGTRETYLSGILFKRDRFQSICGYPKFSTGMAADDAFLFALALHDRLHYIPEAIVRIRLHAGAESQQLLGIPSHLKAVHEFYDYCMAVYKDSSEHLNENVSSLLRRRVRSLNALLWLRGERFLRKGGKITDTAKHELDELYRIAMSSEYDFPVRIRLDAIIRRYTGVYLEMIGLYRVFWEKILRIDPAKG